MKGFVLHFLLVFFHFENLTEPTPSHFMDISLALLVLASTSMEQINITQVT